MGLMGHPLPDFYTLTDVGSLSVTEGPASVLYGSNAMGAPSGSSPRVLCKVNTRISWRVWVPTTQGNIG